MSTKTDLLKKQLEWASNSSLNPDDRGYLESVEDNLFQPLNDMTRTAFIRGSGSELQDTPSRPAKMKALHSSSALAVNVFDYWSNRNNNALSEAIGLKAGISAIKFEAQYPTGLAGNPPNLDVVLELEDGHIIGIESKFTEWLSPKSKSYIPFKPKYFPADQRLWAKRGLPKSQELAEAMYTDDVFFRYLNAAQLLKHALGVVTSYESKCSLFYIYYDSPGKESEKHKEELAIFNDLLDTSLNFKALSYQELFTSLGQVDGIGDDYMKYLKDRYFMQLLPENTIWISVGH